MVACDSTAVFRGIDVGTDKVPLDEQQGVPHHLVDVAEPTEVYSAARYAQDAATVIRAITARGRLPILVGGTGLYFRALVRGLFPGPARHEALRAALDRVASERGTGELHRWVRRLDPESATRIQPRDTKRLIRALEVALVSGVPMTTHFAETVSPIADYDVLASASRLPAADTAARVARRVEQQFDRGVVDEVRRLLAAGVPPARPFAASSTAKCGDAGRRPRRGGHPRTHRPREPALRPPAVDLVPERAYPYVDRRPG